MSFVMLIGVIGIWVLVIWFAKLLATLIQGVRTQQEIIKSFESQSTYFTKIHETVSKLYNPKEIENIVNIRIEKAESEIKSKSTQAIRLLIAQQQRLVLCQTKPAECK